MQHVHLQKTPSTQSALKELLAQNPGDYLISTDFQSQGVGRQGAPWSHFNEALAFSFTLKANDTLTLTPLEIGILLAKFFKSELLLKWPNDLLNSQKEKVGGILCQLVGDIIVVGIGINLISPKEMPQFDYPVGSLFESGTNLKEDYKEALPLEIVTFIKANRLNPIQVQEEFFQFCAHKDQEVTIVNGKESVSGIFRALGANGEAILEDSNQERSSHLTGSLRFN